MLLSNFANSTSGRLGFWCWALLHGVLLLSSGCRSTSDNQIDILERELRTQEDYIYELEDYLVEYSDKLRQYRCENQHASIATPFSKDSEPELAEPSSSSRRSRSERRTTESADQLPAPRDNDPELETDEFSPEEMEIPDDLDLEFDAPVSSREAFNAGREVATAAFRPLRGTRVGNAIIPNPEDFPADEAESEIATLAHEQPSAEQDFPEPDGADEHQTSDRTPQRLVVSRVLRDTVGSEQPRSLLTVVEARDVRDEPVDLEGSVSLMVMSAAGEEPQKLKRWDFTEKETSAAWQSSQYGDGLHLELPVEGEDLEAPALELWVRLVSPDGQRLLTQVPLELEQLLSIDATQPPGGLLEPAGDASASSLRMAKTAADGQTIAANPEPKWRASMERSDQPRSGFSTTAEAASGWTAQPPGGRLIGRPAAVATAPRADTSSSADRHSVQPVGHDEWAPYR